MNKKEALRMVTAGLRFKVLMVLLSLNACNSLFYGPNKTVYSKNLPSYNEIWINENPRLHGWFLSSGPSARGTILFFHGRSKNITFHYQLLDWVNQYNLNLVIIDYRGYGESEGQPSKDTLWQDGIRMMQWLYSQPVEKVGIEKYYVAHSLGGIILQEALLRADQSLVDYADGIVLMGTFSSYQDVAHRNLKANWLTWPVNPLPYLLISDSHADNFAVRQVNRPITVIHGENDRIVPYKNGKEIFENLKQPKFFWSVKGGKHDIEFKNNVVNQKIFLSYLDRMRDISRQASAGASGQNLVDRTAQAKPVVP